MLTTTELYESGLNAAAHYGIFDQTNIPKLRSISALPNVTVGTISNYLSYN